MEKRYGIFLLVMIALHLSFLLLSYDANALSIISRLGDPLIVERTLLLLQFVPLVVVLATKKSENKLLLLVAFSICISTLFVIDDFQTGFFGAVLNYQSNIVPRMRTSATLMAYKDLNHIAVLDPHAEYFLEFLVVNSLSEISGLNYILVYFFMIRAILIVLWSSLFVMASRSIGIRGSSFWSIILASSLLIAAQGYNYEVSFAPALLVLWFIIVNRPLITRRYVVLCAFALVGIFFASFRETVLLLLISAVLTCFYLLGQIGVLRAQSQQKSSLGLVFLVLTLARVFAFSPSLSYFQSYSTWTKALVSSIWQALASRQFSFNSPLLETISSVSNLLDKSIDVVSVVSFFAIITVILAFVFVFLLRRGRPFKSHIALAVSLVYLLVYPIVVGAYFELKILGSGPLHDFSSASVLVRSMAPLVVLGIASCFVGVRLSTKALRRIIFYVVVICLSIALVFSPFVFNRQSVKSSYDSSQASGFSDNNKATVLADNVCNFALSHTEPKESVGLGSRGTYLFTYYSLLLEYRTGTLLSAQSPQNPTATRLFDNGMYIVTSYDNSMLLDETG